MSNNLESISKSAKPTYPVFEPNQLLTSNHLNEMRDYLSMQDRMSRVSLIGVGIVCGLEVSFESDELIITKGTGVTTEGHLLQMDKEKFLQCAESGYADPHNYGLFEDASNIETGQFEMWELLPGEVTAKTDNIVFSNPDFSDFMDDKVVLLFLEYKDIDLESCLGQNCDDKGIKREYTVRKLLINCADAEAIIRRGYNIKAEVPKVDSILNNRFEPDFISMFAYRLLPIDTAPADFNTAFAAINSREYLIGRYDPIYPDNDLNPLKQIADKIEDAYATFNPILKSLVSLDEINQLKVELPKQKLIYDDSIGFQYFFDYTKDLVKAYNEFIEEAFEIVARCCPSTALFPMHLLLAKVIPDKVCIENTCKPAIFRTHFIQSPVYNQQQDKIDQVKSLFMRLIVMTREFRVDLSGADLLKIIPSNEKQAELSERAIPFYYESGNLYKYWNYELSKRCKPQRNIGYHAEKFLPVVKSSQSPLLFDMDAYNFYRIESTIGKSYKEVRNNLEVLKRLYQLDFNVIPLKMRISGSKMPISNCGLVDLKEDYLQLRNELVIELQMINVFLKKAFAIANKIANLDDEPDKGEPIVIDVDTFDDLDEETKRAIVIVAKRLELEAKEKIAAKAREKMEDPDERAKREMLEEEMRAKFEEEEEEKRKLEEFDKEGGVDDAMKREVMEEAAKIEEEEMRRTDEFEKEGEFDERTVKEIMAEAEKLEEEEKKRMAAEEFGEEVEVEIVLDDATRRKILEEAMRMVLEEEEPRDKVPEKYLEFLKLKFDVDVISEVAEVIKTLPKCIDEFNFDEYRVLNKQLKYNIYYTCAWYESVTRAMQAQGLFIDYMFKRMSVDENYFTGYENGLAFLNSRLDIKLGSLLYSYNRRVAAYQSENLFSNFTKKNPGVQHMAGVPKGGTFLLVYGEDGTSENVIADFALETAPCCCEPKFPICDNEEVYPPIARDSYQFYSDEKRDDRELIIEIDVFDDMIDLNVKKTRLLDLLGKRKTVNGARIELIFNDKLNRNIILYRPSKVKDVLFDSFEYRICHDDNEKLNAIATIYISATPPFVSIKDVKEALCCPKDEKDPKEELTEEERLAEEKRLEEEKIAEEKRKEAERLEAERLAEEKRKEEEAGETDEEREKRLEEERLAEEKRKEEEGGEIVETKEELAARLKEEALAEEKRLEEERLAEEKRKEEEGGEIVETKEELAARLKEEALAEEKRLEEERLAEEKRKEEGGEIVETKEELAARLKEEALAEEKRLEEERLAEEKRKEEGGEIVETKEELAARLKEEALAEEKRLEEERLAEEKRKEEGGEIVETKEELAARLKEEALAEEKRLEEERLAEEKRKEEGGEIVETKEELAARLKEEALAEEKRLADEKLGDVDRFDPKNPDGK